MRRNKGNIQWLDQAEDSTLFQVIVDKPRSKLKEAVISHKQGLIARPIIKHEVLTLEPKLDISSTTTNTKQIQNGPLMFNMQIQKHIDNSFEQAKLVKKKQIQKDDSKGKSKFTNSNFL